MTELASAIVGPVVESLLVPVKKHMGYIFLSTERVRNMSARMKLLEGTNVDVENHKDRNDINTLEIPARVPGWLEEVAKIKSDAETISSNENGCFNLKARYKTGRNAWKTTQEIECLLQEGLAFSWTNSEKPLGRVNSKRASTSATSSGGTGDDFRSRDTTFKNALKFLQQDQKTQVIALCGMGGVGKTTMMKQLKKVVEDKKMFDWIVKVDVGKQPNWLSIQQAVAENLGHSLTETVETTRADRLHIRFEETLKKSEKGILVILDNVWEKVELRYVGLSPLHNGVKLLLTSRNEDFCKTIVVEGNLDLKLLKVNVLVEEEAHKFFCQITKISKESDLELYQIGGDIVKKCSCLPLAIKLIAPTLLSKEKSIWEATLGRLRNNDHDQNVLESIKISYDYLKNQEDKEIFLLCGLFPEGSNIPIEDLTRYAWGLKLLNKVPTVGDARFKIITCVRNLKNANLLIDSDWPECVKMHDLVLAFVLNIVSKGDHASIINHGDSSKWSDEDMSESCKRISLTCRGMSEFPKGFKWPNISLLKLMHGDKSFKFPQGFNRNMENLRVIAYERMQYPLLPRSFECSPNLRMLCLHGCSLMFDCSFIGALSNLEVLSITNCGIRKLPSTIGNLKKLKVLDLTGCHDLSIDDGVLIGLVKLEELYMIVFHQHANQSFTDATADELVRCSKNLTTLAIQFNALPKNISFKKLERFKISLGCYVDNYGDQNKYSFENTLRLVTNRCKLLDSGMYELFEKTQVLYLEADEINDLGDGLVESFHHHRSIFNNLRVLHILKCANLRHLFTPHVANALKKLEDLKVSSCPDLETLVDGENSAVEAIKFEALKFLSLEGLPMLKNLCNAVDVVELPQLMVLQLYGLPRFTSIYPKNKLATTSTSNNFHERQPFLNEEVVIPKLEKLNIYNMENLKEIWPNSDQEVNGILREITVERCDSLVNLFPSNPMSLLHRLEEITVRDCGSLEALFNIDIGCVGKTDEVSSSLKIMVVHHLEKLREVVRVNGASANNSSLVILGFQAVESLKISGCKMFRNVFTPTTINFDMTALRDLAISDCGESKRNDEVVNSSQEQEINVMSNEEISEVGDAISNVVFSSKIIHTFHHLCTLNIHNHKRAEVLFEIDFPSSREIATTLQNTQGSPLFPYLKDLALSDIECMSHVWKCNWNKFLIPQKQQLEEPSSSFHNLTTISLYGCNNVRYLFSPLMAKLLSNLKKIKISSCNVIEEVVSNRDDEKEGFVASTNRIPNLFPHLDILSLTYLPNLMRIGGGSEFKGGSNENFHNTTSTSVHHQLKLSQVNDVSWFLCQYSREIDIDYCKALPYVIPSYALGQMQKLEKLTIRGCTSLVEVFETQGTNINGYDATNFDEGSGGNDATMVPPRMKKISVSQLSNLKELVIDDCDLLQDVFSFSTLESIKQLENLRIWNCKAMKVIVKEDNGEETKISSKVVVFPRLKSMQLRYLPNLTGFFLGKNMFRWPLLDDVLIDGCPQMMVFTCGCSITPKLDYIHMDLGKYSTLECGLNFHVKATLHESPLLSLDGTNSCVTTSEGTPWSFHNLIEIDVNRNFDNKKIIPSNELLQLQKLEKINADYNDLVEEVFEALEGTNSSELQSIVVEIPKLGEVKLGRLKNLKYIWKNNPRMVLEFPNLTKLHFELCGRLEHVFTSSMVGSLLQLQELYISNCFRIEVIVKEANVVVEEGEGECDTDDKKVNDIITLPHLKTLTLFRLPSLKGFCLGKEAFSWPSLDTLVIKYCSSITTFTRGELSTPELRVVDTCLGRHELAREHDLNSFIINTKQQQEQGFTFLKTNI